MFELIRIAIVKKNIIAVLKISVRKKSNIFMICYLYFVNFRIISFIVMFFTISFTNNYPIHKF